MRAGRLDRRVAVEVATETDDGYNTVRSWEPLATVACQYIPAAGKEAREMLGQQATMPATFIVRHAERLRPLLSDTENYRLRFPPSDAGQIYDIKAAVNPDRLVTIHITALAAQP